MLIPENNRSWVTLARLVASGQLFPRQVSQVRLAQGELSARWGWAFTASSSTLSFPLQRQEPWLGCLCSAPGAWPRSPGCPCMAGWGSQTLETLLWKCWSRSPGNPVKQQQKCLGQGEKKNLSALSCGPLICMQHMSSSFACQNNPAPVASSKEIRSGEEACTRTTSSTTRKFWKSKDN